MVPLLKRRIDHYSAITESLNTLLDRVIPLVVRLTVLITAVKILIGTVI